MKALCRTKNFSVFRSYSDKFIVGLRDKLLVYRNKDKFAMVPLVYSGTSGRSCSELLRSPTELKRRTRSFSQHSLSNVPQTPPFFNVLPVHCAIPLLTDSPSVSTTHLGRVAENLH